MRSSSSTGGQIKMPMTGGRHSIPPMLLPLLLLLLFNGCHVHCSGELRDSAPPSPLLPSGFNRTTRVLDPARTTQGHRIPVIIGKSYRPSKHSGSLPYTPSTPSCDAPPCNPTRG